MANSKPSICFDCQNGYAHKCKWVAFKTPIPGWKAEKRVFKQTVGTGFTYQVTSCPNFKKEQRAEVTIGQTTITKEELDRRIKALAEGTDWAIPEIAKACDVSYSRVWELIHGIQRYTKCANCGNKIALKGGRRKKYCDQCAKYCTKYKRKKEKK